MGRKKMKNAQRHVEQSIKDIRLFFYENQPFDNKKRLKNTSNNHYLYMQYIFYRAEEMIKAETNKRFEETLYNALNGKKDV